jgi:isopentenyldiphosphate isomerase
MDEWIDIVDERDEVTGRATRREMRSRNLLHRNIAVLCLNSAGHVYVQRRSESKDLFPGMYDTFVGGVVTAGESYDACAVRELAEELGVRGPQPERLFMFRYDGPETRSHTSVYRVLWDGPIVHQASEVAWGGFLALEEIVVNSRTWRFVPDNWLGFQHYLQRVASEPRQPSE